jgi:diacylglycerol kinase
MFFRSRLSSFRPAFAGCWHLLRTQPNTWIHAVISLLVIGLGVWLQLDFGSWAMIAVTMGFVWAAEAFNTAIEAIVDLASPGHHPLAKVAKDVSAAAVVIAAVSAVAVGLLILGPPLWARLLGN